MERVLITGGLGFIGCHVVEYFHKKNPQMIVVNADAENYSCNPEKKEEFNTWDRYFFERVDITHRLKVRDLLEKYEPDHVIHLAAESHVCRSIEGPDKFFETNTMGTFNLIDEFRIFWSKRGGYSGKKFYYISTDEIFGELGPDDERFDEECPIRPRSPYAASKACGNHIVNSFHVTYGMNTLISSCSNNFGPWQHEEKLIPKVIKSLRLGEPVQVYGNGTQVKDWIFVEEHARAIHQIFEKGRPGSFYCVGGKMELSNLEMIRVVAEVMNGFRRSELNLEFVNNRPTDDFRYAIDNQKIEKEIDFIVHWEGFKNQMDKTVEWYLKKMA